MDFLKRQRLIFTPREMELIEGASVIIAGAGGLGTHQALELQRTGIKKIYLIDHDEIEPSNLNRQILYGRGDIGRSKVRAAERSLNRFELNTEIVAVRKKIEAGMELPADADLILDALDSRESRYQLENLAAGANLPLIHGAVSAWQGQVTTIIPGKTIGMEDIYGETQKEDTQNPPATLSPVVSVIASLQVVEGIKVIVGRKNLLTNSLLLVDLQAMTCEKIEIRPSH